LVDFALKLPVDWKLQRNDQGYQGKYLLREVMARYVPEIVVKQKKQGFAAPDANWFRSLDIVSIKALFDKQNNIYQYLSYNNITQRLQDHISGQKNYRGLIWSLISFSHFLNQYFS
jgi:asparagine synthase (glutamine-hydrolysing)